ATTLLTTLFIASLRLFPAGFRNSYAEEMKEIFVDRIQSLGRLAACAATLAEILDVAVSAFRIRFAHGAYMRPAMIGTTSMIILAAMLSAHDADRSTSRSLHIQADSIDFNAHDPAGEFTIAIRHGRPVAATIDHVPLPRNRLLHSGDSIRVLGPTGHIVLALAYYHDRARIEWEPRPSVCRGHALDCTLYQ
ncbi:MAG: hypothetical protein ABR582_15390, partial [Gemmatimonadaceae bacterium]